MCVSVHPVLWRECHFIEVATVVTAFAWLDEHGWPLEALAVRADEGHRYCACAAWRAAPSVCTHTAVVGPVEAGAHTLSVGQADGLWGFLCWGALLPSLWLDNNSNRMSVIFWIIVNVVAHAWLASVQKKKKITKTSGDYFHYKYITFIGPVLLHNS